MKFDPCSQCGCDPCSGGSPCGDLEGPYDPNGGPKK